MFSKILIANRGEIAVRIIKSARRLGVKTVVVYSEADKGSKAVEMADEAIAIGGPTAAESYLVQERILKAAKDSGAEAIHPGFGFLSENASFAEAVAEAGLVFIGPTPHAIRAMGDKIESKRLAEKAGVSIAPGFDGALTSDEDALKVAKDIGYPVMIKASAGGGGKGMRIAWNAAEAREGFQSSKNEAKNAFGDDRIFIEKFVTEPRHIEIQVLGDKHGNCLYLGERECSIQRRNQKVIEEAPSPFLDEATRRAMGEQAVALAKAVGYHSAGTVEFIVDGKENRFYFLEMNTRLQVEHPVTELVTGLDLVEQMIRVAAGEALSFGQDDVELKGWAIESRLYAEDPYRNFLPSIGRLTRYRPPEEGDYPDGSVVRNDTGVTEGGEISMYYDPMIAKLCTHAPDRASAIDAMSDALDNFEVEGIGHNLPFLSAVMRQERFRSGKLTTAYIAEEFPDGFAGVAPDDHAARMLAAIAALINYRVQDRAAHISGTIDNHRRTISPDWVVTLAGHAFTLKIAAGSIATITFADGKTASVASDWQPGMRHARFDVDGRAAGIKVDLKGPAIRLRWRGMDVTARVRSPRVAALAKLMPEKAPPDTSKMLLCPMPGVITALSVATGDTVEAGQALATVEAMKMENILRAERRGVVKAVAVETGQSLAVDEMIMEFE